VEEDFGGGDFFGVVLGVLLTVVGSCGSVGTAAVFGAFTIVLHFFSLDLEGFLVLWQGDFWILLTSAILEEGFLVLWQGYFWILLTSAILEEGFLVLWQGYFWILLTSAFSH